MKKYILLFFIILAAFALPQVGLAANYFVGVTIASGQAPGNPSPATNTNWCLPARGSSYGTQFYIRNGTTNLTPVSPTANPINLPGPACAGDTVWSGLFNLTSGTTYNAYFNLGGNNYNYCPGFWGSTGDTNCNNNCTSTCWVSWDTPGQNKSCNQVCSYYNLTNTYYTGTYPWQIMGYSDGLNCGIVSKLLGGTCSSCTQNATADYYNPTTFACYTTQSWYWAADAGGNGVLNDSSLVRVCPCNIQTTYTNINFAFNFTPTF